MPVIEFTRDHMREVSVQSVSLLSQLCQEELTCPSEELPQQMENPGEDMGRDGEVAEASEKWEG